LKGRGLLGRKGRRLLDSGQRVSFQVKEGEKKRKKGPKSKKLDWTYVSRNDTRKPHNKKMAQRGKKRGKGANPEGGVFDRDAEWITLWEVSVRTKREANMERKWG